MIRSSKHYLTSANSGKIRALREFLAEYRKMLQLCIDHIWQTKFDGWDIDKDLLNLPKYLDYQEVPYEGKLSARARCSALEQSIGIVRSNIQKRKQLLWVLDKLRAERKDTSYIEKQLTKHILSKPSVSDKIPAELSSKCVDFDFESNHFDCFLRVKSIGFDAIKLPLQYTKPFLKRKDWKLLGGVSLHEDYICLRQETNAPELKSKGKIVGADTGILSVITLSDHQTSRKDIHHHDLNSITEKLSRKKKGSKAFRRAQEHRKNYINWSINQLNLTDVKEVKLEKVNTFTGGGKSRKLSHFAHSLISSKLEQVCEEAGVRLSEQPNIFKSQRCSGCGMVCKGNRKKKECECRNCHLQIDADLNSAINNALDLPPIPFALQRQGLNRKGFFFWKEEGFFDLDGREIHLGQMPEMDEFPMPKKV